MLKKLGKPRLTVILTANEQTVIERLKSRDPNDHDIQKAVKTKAVSERMIFFCEKFVLPAAGLARYNADIIHPAYCIVNRLRRTVPAIKKNS